MQKPYPADTLSLKKHIPQTLFYSKTLSRKHFFIQKAYPARIVFTQNSYPANNFFGTKHISRKHISRKHSKGGSGGLRPPANNHELFIFPSIHFFKIRRAVQNDHSNFLRLFHRNAEYNYFKFETLIFSINSFYPDGIP